MATFLVMNNSLHVDPTPDAREAMYKSLLSKENLSLALGAVAVILTAVLLGLLVSKKLRVACDEPKAPAPKEADVVEDAPKKLSGASIKSVKSVKAEKAEKAEAAEASVVRDADRMRATEADRDGLVVRSGYKLGCDAAASLDAAVAAAKKAGGDPAAIQAAAKKLAAQYAARGADLAPMTVVPSQEVQKDRASANPYSSLPASNAPMGAVNGGPDMPMADAPMSADAQQACDASRIAVQLVNDLFGKDGVSVDVPSAPGLQPTYAEAVDAYVTTSNWDNSLAQTSIPTSVDSNGNASVPMGMEAKLTANFNPEAVAQSMVKTGVYGAPPEAAVNLASNAANASGRALAAGTLIPSDVQGRVGPATSALGRQ